MTAEYRGTHSPKKRRETDYEVEFEEKTPRKLEPKSLSSKFNRKNQNLIVAKQFKIEKASNLSSVPDNPN